MKPEDFKDHIEFTEQDDFELKTLPEFVEKDIRAFMTIINGESDDPIDMLWGEVYGSINSAQHGHEITKEKADHLRRKYLLLG